jgi:predicted acylesterase/phospholipase RssA
MQKADSSAELSFVAAKSPQELSEASSEGGMDSSSQSLRDFEWQRYIGLRRRHYRDPVLARSALEPADPEDPAPEDLTGIALSGGGIRSATFALGVLQALAHHDLLRRFDYLSTVSGGGYIGTSLTWLTSKLATDKAAADKAEAAKAAPSLPRGGFGLGPSCVPAAGRSPGESAVASPFPYGSDDPRLAREPDGTQAEGAMLRYLRQHGNYLTPGKGITLTSVIVVLLRGIILNLLVWIPIVATVMWLSIWSSLHWFPAWLPLWLPPSIVEFVGTISPASQSDQFESSISPSLRSDEFMLSMSPRVGSDEVMVSLSPPPQADDKEFPKLLLFGIMLAATMLLFAGCVAAFAVYSLVTWLGHKSRRWLLGGTKYAWRRGFERWIRVPFWIMGVALLLASVPFIAGSLHGWLLGSSFSVIGLASGLLAFVRTMRQPKSQAEKQTSWAVPSSWLASFGAAFLLYGVLLVSYGFGWWAAQGSAAFEFPFYVLLGALAAAIITGWFVDLNLVTIHRFYRDRLMEAFLPDIRQALANETAPAEQADSAALSSMCDPDRPVGPYHIINTNLVLIKSDERTYRMRGGDSFVLSPLFCGSNATGWQPTDAFMGDELTVPTAMAISGAAANPWTGSGGVGLTRNPLVGMLMALMNLRLGFWLPNPNPKSRVRWWRRSCKRSFRANHFEPGLKEVLGAASLRETSPVCLLSDGGHFENLALYELVRRRCRLIVLCDGTADPDYAFTDLQNAMARISTDFGARVEFDQEKTLRCFMPSIEAGYPRDVRLSESAYTIADITYADGSPGKLVYLTTALCEGLRLKLLGYKGANRDFPDQSTADQFFDEEQFEAYRELGYVIAATAAPHIADIFERLQPLQGVPEAAE